MVGPLERDWGHQSEHVGSGGEEGSDLKTSGAGLPLCGHGKTLCGCKNSILRTLESLNNGDRASSSRIIKCKKHTKNMCRRIVNTLSRHFLDLFGKLLGDFWQTF
jgi:hypothetical protein